MKSAAKQAIKAESGKSIRCVGECILLRRIEDHAKEITEGGIAVPEIARQKSNRGEVVALGEGRFVNGHWISMGLCVGDIVHYSKLAVGMDVPFQGETLLKLHVKQIDLVESDD